MTDTPNTVTPQDERFTDNDRNLILNRTLTDLDRIINDHDPEVDTSLNNGIWDRLDKMACEIEARAAMQPTPAEAAKVLLDAHESIPAAAKLKMVQIQCGAEGVARPVLIANMWRGALRAIASEDAP